MDEDLLYAKQFAWDHEQQDYIFQACSKTYIENSSKKLRNLQLQNLNMKFFSLRPTLERYFSPSLKCVLDSNIREFQD